MFKSNNNQTNRPICEDDWAVILCDNHRILEPEYMDLQAMLLKMGSFMNLNTKQAVDFSMVEERNPGLPDGFKFARRGKDHGGRRMKKKLIGWLPCCCFSPLIRSTPLF